MLSKFFLERPVFAWVVAIFIMLLGGLAIYNLPVAQYPNLAPPSIAVTASYPGASAETVENSVTQVIEQKMTGLDGMLYLSSNSDSAGQSRIELTFAPGTDPDLAWTKVQNRLQPALASLPDVVQRSGVLVNKSTRNWLIMVGLVNKDGSMNDIDIGDYAATNIEDILARVPGVGEVERFAKEYAMRVWLDVERLNDFNLSIEDVVAALRSYNVEVSAGQFGSLPAVAGQRLNASIVVQNLLRTPEDFANIPVRTNSDGAVVRVRDIGRTELGTAFYDVNVLFNGNPAAMLAIRQTPGANALTTANAIKAKMKELQRNFPPGIEVVYPFDTTPFVRVAIMEAVKSLFQAIFLVFLVMLIFMGNVRATLIPTIAIPVVLLGTCGALAVFGFSINMLTMFAMVIAIGLLVDDTIVVVENVERLMSEEGLSPREATAKSMSEVTSALIGFALVLCALFGPMAFFSGSTGIIYRQFSITVVTSMFFSVTIALILTPVLCASILKPVAKGHEAAEGTVWFLRPFLLWFDRAFNRFRDAIVAVVGYGLARMVRFVLVYLVIICIGVFLAKRISTSYLPDEDQGILFTQVMLQTGATLEQTQDVLKKVYDYYMANEADAIESCATIAGVGFSGQAQNNGMIFVKLKDWHLRRDPSMHAEAIAGRAMVGLSSLRNAMVFTFPPPAIAELGTSQGFDFMLVDRAGHGHEALYNARNQLMGMAMQDPRLASIRPNGLEDVPEYRVDVDWEKAGALGLPISAIHNTISAAFGSAYVNDFILNGRIKRVFVQADAPYRMLPENLDELYVRNVSGQMVPYRAFAKGRWSSGSPQLERFNAAPSVNLWGQAAPGYSSGDAMQAMEELTRRLPQGFDYDWTGLSYQERQSTSQTGLLYAFSIIVVFLFLAALYGKWDIPISVLLILPLGVIGGFIATMSRGMPSDVYFQIGMLNTLGLATKNAILIVQFAMSNVAQGHGLIEAALHAVRLRLRAIVMTSMTTGLSVLPMALSSGAGAGAMNAIGTVVLGGMISGTILVVIFAPLFYVLIEGLFGTHKKKIRSNLQPAKLAKATSILIALSLGATVCCSGCKSMAPDYERPEAPMPAQWSAGDAYQNATGEAPAVILPWREFFQDPTLQTLIDSALANNRDLRLAALNTEMARALYGVERDALYPALYATANAVKQKNSAHLTGEGQSRRVENYSVNAGILSWEPDFFGRVRSYSDEALAKYFASLEAKRSVEILVVSSVVNAYLNLAADREALALAKDTLKNQQDALALVKKQYEQGLVTELALRQAQTPVESARGDTARLTRVVAQDLNALQLLLGSALPAELPAQRLNDIQLDGEVQAGLPSELLLNRPDIIAAEQQLKAANALIGVARAAFFPSIAITAIFGSASNELSGLFEGGAGTWSFAPQLALPIFDARTWSGYRVSKAHREIAVVEYERAIQQAFREVNDVLALRGTINEQLDAQQALVDTLSETHRLATLRFENGVDSFLPVLDAQRNLFAAQHGLIALKLAKASSKVQLYAALGGGSNPSNNETTPEQP
ncbi:efflux RND transporter permease subunit [Oligosphaera ethanolica]|uniref:Hydrophobe/amphiphile efflux-1 (HAE1) family protein/NodT family efflux transporter outer membrane factor (OMF) lipoprotein n=1 Tax=Oligosphaera ethanolica TaxID=760260 RepID=A0AAE3VJW4_9BACT|nr:efflux RND transporter permease subunit [Oligosphaera ethanolica]MDQ0291666.1 hydrophobe/amphiphile efflux-1 (HAE1) family protein/NodT family efflux transporter outer membrane factor (OMF) lipoprotein [Oligosphaera ethanolica]